MVSSSFRPRDLHEQLVRVEFRYPVVFTREALRTEDETLAWAVTRGKPARHPVFVVLDGGLVAARPALADAVKRYTSAHADVLGLRAEPFVVPGGEAAKNDPALIDELLGEFASARLDRHAAVIAIGGGAVLDAVGYAASIAHRGIRLVRVPSTVLAQCDGGVGVKTSVNAFASKNFVGTFAPPYAVLDDFELLSTLPLRDARAGMAEAVKVALIRDPEFFGWLENHAEALSRAEAGPLAALVRRAAELHLRHISEGGDPFETGSARPLDYGHWAAHKLEIMSGHELRHGEAVAIGMLLDARYAERTGLLKPDELNRLTAVLERLGLPLYHPALAQRTGGKLSILRGLQEFREHLGGELSVTMLLGIGRSRELSEIDEASVESALAWLAERAHGT